MPKRTREEKEERWTRKLRKYEEKLRERRRRISQRIIYSSDENDEQHEEHLETGLFNLGDADDVVYDHFAVATNDDLLPDNDVETPLVEGLSVEAPIVEAPIVEAPITEAPITEATVAEEFDVEMLRALGDNEPEVVECSEDLHLDIATRFQQILANGLKKEVKDELVKKYLFPNNVPLLKAPTLNPEIEAMLVETCRLRDKRLFSKQDQLGRALSALGKAMTGLLKKNPDIPDVIRTLNDSGKLFADSHYTETDTRRAVIIPLVEKSLIDPFKKRKRDNFLFGESLCEVVKNSRGIKKTSKLIQAVASTSTSGLNYKGPSNRPRQQWIGQNYPQYRAGVGGPRASYPNNWRAAAGPPPRPPAARRYPPLPTPLPPPRRQSARAQRHRATDRPQK